MRHMVRLLVMACIAVPLVATSQVAVVHASEGLDFSGTFNYAVDVATGIVHVSADLTMANNDVSTRESRDCYYGFTIPVPLTAKWFTNTSSNPAYGYPDSFDVALHPADNGSGYQLADIVMQGCIGFERPSVHSTIAYQFSFSAPRSLGSERLNPSLISFPVPGVGRPSNVTIQVTFPSTYTAENLDSPWKSTTNGGQTTFTLPAPSDPDDAGAFVIARNDAELATTPVVTETDRTFDVRAWPDDPA